MSKELTDAYRSKKLKKGWYWVKFNCFAKIYPSFYEKGYFWDDGKVEEVLSPCDYEVPDHLETKAEWQAERIKELEQEVKTLTNNYKLLEDKQASDIIHGQALVDEFGDFEALYEELQNLRSILKECKNIVAHDCWQEAQFPDGQIARRKDILKRLEKALNEFN